MANKFASLYAGDYRGPHYDNLPAETERRAVMVEAAARQIGLVGDLEAYYVNDQVMIRQADCVPAYAVGDRWPLGVWFSREALSAPAVKVSKNHRGEWGAEPLLD